MNQQMHVVRHHHPGAEFIEVSLDLTDHNGLGYQICDSRVLQPSRFWTTTIQGTVSSYERLACS